MKFLYAGFIVYVAILLGWQMSYPQSKVNTKKVKKENYKIASDLQILVNEKQKTSRNRR